MPFRKRPNLELIGAGELVDTIQFRPSEFERNSLSAGPLVRDGNLSFRAMGSADDPGGLWFWVDGVGPNEPYDLRVHYPEDSKFKGAVYTYVKGGRTDEYGASSGMRWDPYVTRTGWPDPEGIFPIQYRVRRTGEVINASFLMKYDRSFAGRVARYLRIASALGRRVIGYVARELRHMDGDDLSD